MSTGWLVIEAGRGEVHVIPDKDTYEHRLSSFCECEPRVNEESNGYVVNHRSFDGREFQDDED